MANILILSPQVPFVRGGAEALVNTLCNELKARDHLVDIVQLPLSLDDVDLIPKQAALWRALDLNTFGGKDIDLVIATKFPSYYAKHRNKSVWLVHQHRAAYDLYGSSFSDFSDDPRDEEVRRMIIEGDTKVLSEAKYIGCISRNVANRLKLFNEIESDVLYPPLPLGGRYRAADKGSYILYVGRLCRIKRVDLMIKALPHLPSELKFFIVGMPDEKGIVEYYNNEIKKHHLSNRVQFLGRVSDEELIELYSKCFCVYYAPYDEDYGFVTLEAFASEKPVITACDSGGVLEFIEHKKTGLVVKPDPYSIADGINMLLRDTAMYNSIVAEGKALVSKLHVLEDGWDIVVDKLLAPLTKLDREASLG